MALLSGAGGMSHAASLKVSPARFIVHDVAPGVEYDVYQETGLRITIYNDDDTPRTWIVSTHRPSERGQWERGYTEIPDAAWCWFDRNEITVQPGDKAFAHLFIKVPPGAKYNNQHWVVTLGIDGAPGAAGLALAADVRVQIETKSVSEPGERPDGFLGLAPSIVAFDSVDPGSRLAGAFNLYNNDSKPHRYAIASLYDDASIDPKVYATSTYTPLSDLSWLTFIREIEIGPGGSGAVNLELMVPEGATPAGTRHEAILLVKPDTGPPGFVRVRAVIEGPAETENKNP